MTAEEAQLQFAQQAKNLVAMRRDHPDEILINTEGSAIFALTEDETLLIIEPPDGMNYNSMSDEEVQAHLRDYQIQNN